jgi:hypothetical protein
MRAGQGGLVIAVGYRASDFGFQVFATRRPLRGVPVRSHSYQRSIPRTLAPNPRLLYLEFVLERADFCSPFVNTTSGMRKCVFPS